MNKEASAGSGSELNEAIADEKKFFISNREQSKHFHDKIASMSLALYAAKKFNEFECSIRKRLLNYYCVQYSNSQQKNERGNSDIDKSGGFYFEDLMFYLFKQKYGDIANVEKQQKFPIKNRRLAYKKLDICIGPTIGIELKAGLGTTEVNKCYKDYTDLRSANGAKFIYFCIGGGLYKQKLRAYP